MVKIATIDIKLKTYEQLQFEIMKLNTDIVLKNKEIDRLNNIISKLEKELDYEIKDYDGDIDIETRNIDSEFLRGNAWEADYLKNKLKELKEKE